VHLVRVYLRVNVLRDSKSRFETRNRAPPGRSVQCFVSDVSCFTCRVHLHGVDFGVDIQREVEVVRLGSRLDP
jgi:hypothetical protein